MTLLIALLLFGYVLPVERVVLQLAAERATRPPLEVLAELEGLGEDWPREVRFGLHPELGLRVASRDQRWLFAGGEALAGTNLPAPPWIPDLEILSLADPEALMARLDQLGVDPNASDLARCGEFDCFVLGGRAAGPQVWVNKDRFEVVRVRASAGAGVEFSAWQEWDGLRFPAEIRVFDAFGTISTFRVTAVAAARRLGEPDFSRAWVEALPPRAPAPSGVPPPAGLQSIQP
jgi:hypothetical protein